MRAWFRHFPLEGARWILGEIFRPEDRLRVHQARWIEQPPKGPSHLVPPPRSPDDGPLTTEGLLAHVIRESMEDEARRSDGKLRVEFLDFDGEEAMRQTLAEGGCDIELLLEAEHKGGKPTQWILGVLLPDEEEDGAATAREHLRATSWHLLAGPSITRAKAHDLPPFVTVPLYLWPGTGLRDPQESCSVFRGEPKLPGLLGALMDHASRDEEEDLKRTRKTNRSRLSFHQRADQARREAAARRRERTGDAGITDEALAALMPDIDLDRDFVTLLSMYDIVRLWDDSMDALLERLPPECLGLALFGHRPAGMSDLEAAERCAFELRRALRGRPNSETRRAGTSLAVLATAFLDSAVVERLVRTMKLF